MWILEFGSWQSCSSFTSFCHHVSQNLDYYVLYSSWNVWKLDANLHVTSPLDQPTKNVFLRIF